MDESNVTPHRRRGGILWGRAQPNWAAPTPYQNLAIAIVESAAKTNDWKWFLTDWARLLIEGCGVRYPYLIEQLRLQKRTPYGKWPV